MQTAKKTFFIILSISAIKKNLFRQVQNVKWKNKNTKWNKKARVINFPGICSETSGTFMGTGVDLRMM